MDNKNQILKILEEYYRDADTELVFGSVFELLVSVMLSAQCMDVRVNKVTKELFKLYNTPQSISEMDDVLLEEYIKSCGLYKNKAKNIKATAITIREKFGGEVPRTREELMSLPGVGRKTANVILSVGFGMPAMAVDTHVFRVSNRMGLADASTPEGVEKQLTELIQENMLGHAHHWLIHHGRRICHSQKPDCKNCPVVEFCKYYNSNR